MHTLLLFILVCRQYSLYWATDYIPCGLTRCYNVGNEVCIGPPEVRTKADSDCYSCDVLAQVENPCDPAGKRHGCMKYCTDKALEEQRQTWNQSQEIFTRTKHEFMKPHTGELQNEQRLRERNHAIITVLSCLAAFIVMVSVVVCMHRQYKRNRKQKEERETSSSTALVPAYSDIELITERTELINESENNITPEQLNKETDSNRAPVTHSFDNNDTDATTEARSEPRGKSPTDTVDQPGASIGVGSPKLHDGKCHDERLCNVSPQSQDPGQLCTHSSYCKWPSDIN